MVIRRSRSSTTRISFRMRIKESPRSYPAESVKTWRNWSQSPNWSQLRSRLHETIGLGGSVWESNPPSTPRRDGSPALKTGRITGPLAPPFIGSRSHHAGSYHGAELATAVPAQRGTLHLQPYVDVVWSQSGDRKQLILSSIFCGVSTSGRAYTRSSAE